MKHVQYCCGYAERDTTGYLKHLGAETQTAKKHGELPDEETVTREDHFGIYYEVDDPLKTY